MPTRSVAPASRETTADRRTVHPLVRFSPHYFNTDEEIDRTVAAIAGLSAAA